jgi:GT2 family glycosyltransferase
MKTAHECEIHYQWSRSVGLSLGRNLAIRLARYEYLAVTDDDVLVAPNWLSKLILALAEEGSKCVVTGRVLAVETSGGGFAPSLNTEEESRVYQGRIWKDALWAGNMAMHRSVIGSIGLFDERLGAGSPFPGAEDNDYGFRLLESGFHIKYVPEAIVYHRAWRTADDYVPLRWNYGYGQGAFFAKHSSLRDGYMLQRIRTAIMRHGSRLVWDGLRRSRHQNLGEIVYILGLLCGAAKWLMTQPRTG